MENNSMDVDSSNANNGNLTPLKDKCLVAVPVAGGTSGEGLPYAPEDWPYPGDKWRWKVGYRVASNGHYQDKTLYAPVSCPKYDGKKPVFASRASLKDYLTKQFPQVNVDAFFSQFIWKVPASNNIEAGTLQNIPVHEPSRRLAGSEQGRPEVAIRPGGCKAGNKSCSSRDTQRTKDCKVCCFGDTFCCDCCCILCYQTVDFEHGGYSFIRCEAMVDHNVCRHVAHVNCALRAYMAGTVGGSINLDVEYYCRLCDNRTDLMSHVSKLLKYCESLVSSDEIEKILHIGSCILHGSEQNRANLLRSHIGQASSKLKRGVCFDEIRKMDDDKSNMTSVVNGHTFKDCTKGFGYKTGCTLEEGASLTGKDSLLLGIIKEERKGSKLSCVNNLDPVQKMKATIGHAQSPVYVRSEYSNLSVELEDEVDKALKDLVKSQQTESLIAEEKLYHQKDILVGLYDKLDYDRSLLANPGISPYPNGSDDLLPNVLERVAQIKVEEERLAEMLKVAQGFGRVSRTNLSVNFGIDIHD